MGCAQGFALVYYVDYFDVCVRLVLLLDFFVKFCRGGVVWEILFAWWAEVVLV